MDFVTHSLVGATTARLFARRPEELPALALTGVLASLIMDGDSWLAMLGPAAYGRWHRVASHSLVGLIVCAGLALAFVFAVQVIPRARRFGWFVSPKLGVETVPVFPAALKLIAVAALAAALHWLGDVITGFGNMKLFWPWSDCDFSLSAVTSFDWFLFLLTMGWHVMARTIGGLSFGREAAIAGVWFLCAAGYVLIRLSAFEPTVW